MNITLYGSASNHIDPVYIDGVEALGRAIAQRGHTLVFGAGSTGLMGAAARGAAAEGGRIVGVTPRFMNELEPVSTLCTELIATETMAERKTKMEELADAFVIVPGGLGTLDEFFQIMTLRVLSRHDKPVVLYNINGFWDDLLALIRTYIDRGFIAAEVAEELHLTSSPSALFAVLEAADK